MDITKQKKAKRPRIKRAKISDELTTPGQAYQNASLVMGTSQIKK